MNRNIASTEPDCRVVLVGHAPGGAISGGLEGALRAEPGFELIRARDPLLALGELAMQDGASPAIPTAIVLRRGALLPDEATDFVAAAYRLAPTAVILDDSSRPGASSTLTPGAIRLALAGRRATHADAERPTPPASPALANPVAPTLTAPSASPSRAPGAPTDERRSWDDPAPGPTAPPVPTDTDTAAALAEAPILRAIIAGADVLGPCVEELRRRLGDPSAEFADEGASPPPLPGSRTLPVERRGAALGSLRVSDRVPIAQAEAGARWLALWIALREQQEQLREAAFTDPLTGVWNRRYFDRFLPKALERARERRHELSLLVFDVDNFKRFNDRFGHAAGDDILIETSRLIRAVVRPTDRVCRIGGDEFAVIFYEPDGPRDPASRHPNSIAAIVARFQEQIREQRFPKLGAHAPGALSISGGMATFPWDAADPTSLLARADALALESKGFGKNLIRFGEGRPPGAQAPVQD